MQIPIFNNLLTKKHNQYLPFILFLIYSIYISLFLNNLLWNKIFIGYPVFKKEFLFYISLFIQLVFSNFLFITILFPIKFYRTAITIIIILSSFISYFSDNFGTIIDKQMIINTFNTNSKEVLELINPSLIKTLILKGIFPLLPLIFLKSEKISFKKNFLIRLICVFLSILIIMTPVILQPKRYASFLRTQKHIREAANPLFPIYSLYKYFLKINKRPKVFKEITTFVIKKQKQRNSIVVFIVGESQRADHLYINGYQRNTNPLLSKRDILSAKNFYSCGTSTADSVPCMFSDLGIKKFSIEKADGRENLLDILKKAKINVFWLDNNYSSYHVADRVFYKSFRSPDINPKCDIECRDEGMIEWAFKNIDFKENKDFFIVFHQMGNHGPAYYKRYPKKFKVFNPACENEDLKKCSNEEIINAYDNATIHTDYFINEIISRLEKIKNKDIMLIYTSDHGESLGEKGVYLHAMPLIFAPEEQRKVPLIIWNKGFENKIKVMRKNINKKISHDIIFSSLLGLYDINTDVYTPEMDIFSEKFAYIYK